MSFIYGIADGPVGFAAITGAICWAGTACICAGGAGGGAGTGGACIMVAGAMELMARVETGVDEGKTEEPVDQVGTLDVEIEEDDA